MVSISVKIILTFKVKSDRYRMMVKKSHVFLAIKPLTETMKGTQKIIWIVSCLISLSAFGQGSDLPQELKDHYYSDSIKVGEFQDKLYDSLKLANTQHPARFFMMCGSFIQDSMMNEAAVSFFIGRNRYKLYNKTNPDYEASGDGALAGSFAYIYGEILNDYLTKNLENYGRIMQLAGGWYSKNRHFYFESSENDSLYQLQTNSILEFADMLLNNPTEYIQQLEDERKQMEEFLEQLNDSMEELELEEGEGNDK